MQCPICDHTGLDADVISCPSCKADLTAYHELDSIKVSTKKQKTVSLIIIILFILALLGCVFIYFMMNQEGNDTQKATENELVIQKLQEEKQALQNTVNTLQKENSALKESNKEATAPKQVKHIIKEGESLYTIAQTYLGDGKRYPKIAADNGIENPDIIIIGKELIINK